MSEEKTRDNLRRGPPLPTAEERAASKGPPSTREFRKAAYSILFIGVGAFFIVITLILWPNVPPGYQAAIIGFFYWQYAPYGLTAVLVTVVVSVLGPGWYRRIRGRGKVQGTHQVTEQPEAQRGKATAASAGVSTAPRPPPSTTGAIFVRCRLCPQTYRADRPEGEPWLTLLNHVFEHYKELAYVRDEYPDQESMYEIMHKWYEEIKR